MHPDTTTHAMSPHTQTWQIHLREIKQLVSRKLEKTRKGSSSSYTCTTFTVFEVVCKQSWSSFCAYSQWILLNYYSWLMVNILMDFTAIVWCVVVLSDHCSLFLRLLFLSDISESSIPHALHLIHPKVKHNILLAQKVQLVSALKVKPPTLSASLFCCSSNQLASLGAVISLPISPLPLPLSILSRSVLQHIFLLLSLSLSACLPICISPSQALYAHLCSPSVCVLSACLSVCRSTYLSVFVFIC